MKKREHRLFIRVTDEERNRILDKMYGMRPFSPHSATFSSS